MRIKNLLCAMMLMAPAAMAAQEDNMPEFRTWAPTAPKGWNSWDCYYSTVNEKLVLQNAQYMKDNLLEYGWEYVVIDIRWYANHPSLGGGWYNHEKTPECQLDEYGRYVPSPTRFPSAMKDGRNIGFKALADAIHDMGLKFGIHIMRGLPKYILDAPENYRLKGAEDMAWDKVYKSTRPEYAWLDAKAVFKEAAHWSKHHVKGCYADCDMLPLGRISMTVEDQGFANYDAGRIVWTSEDPSTTAASASRTPRRASSSTSSTSTRA